ncbi:MAG: hypothetical protein BAA03_15200 [Caldibacillus debilis]|nr:MAG: hypothetical protein BAA03_15200 [Caldibacillus debilis]
MPDRPAAGARRYSYQGEIAAGRLVGRSFRNPRHRLERQAASYDEGGFRPLAACLATGARQPVQPKFQFP